MFFRCVVYLDNIEGLASEDLGYPANRPGSNILDGSSNVLIVSGHRPRKTKGAIDATVVDEQEPMDESIQVGRTKRKKKLSLCDGTRGLRTDGSREDVNDWRV